MIHLKGLTGAITARLIAGISLSIVIMSALGYRQLVQETEANSSIRIDRAARAAVALFTDTFETEFIPIRDADGKPLAIRLREDTADSSLSFREEYDTLLFEIGAVNQGAANLFVFNSDSSTFDRFVTTFRMPDGSMPPPMSIGSGHIAFPNISDNQPYIGEVPVMGRMRLANLIPIQTQGGAIAGALAVDVGWADDLLTARNELRMQMTVAAISIVFFVSSFAVLRMNKELKPLRELAQFAEKLASGEPAQSVPHRSRNDEIGALSQGLERVVELQRKLAYLAYTDDMTGLGNQRSYQEGLKTALKESETNLHQPALWLVDIDNFKQCIDAYGQGTGNEVLKATAARLAACVCETDRVYRLTSDQFAILLTGHGPNDQAPVLAEKILEFLTQPFQLATGQMQITASIGAFWLNQDASDSDGAHRKAGLALRAAKSQGGNHYVSFTSDLDDALQDQLQMEKRLGSAIKNREIEIHFQPQILPSTNELVGVEALARWSDPETGTIPPAKFIPLAETTGQIIDLGHLVLDLACEQAAKWADEGFDFKHIAVNVSPVQLWQHDFIDKLKFLLDQHNVDAEKVYLEITESMFVDHSEPQIAAVLDAICALGIKLSLDDFGSGYSSLNYLNRLPLNQLKIDRLFVSELHLDTRKQGVLHGILGLGHGLGFDIVVEGAETLEEVTLVAQMTGASVQGYYYSKPVPAQQLPLTVLELAQSGNLSRKHSA